MRVIIEGFKIPDNPAAFSGLEASEVSRLPQIAIFTGPNGGGKSRLLRTIVSQAPTGRERPAIVQRLSSLQAVLAQQALTQAPNTMRPRRTPPFESQIAQLELQLSTTAAFEYAKDIAVPPITLYFAPSISMFGDPNQLTFGQAAAFLNQGGLIKNIAGNFGHSLTTVQSLITNYLMSRSNELQFDPAVAMEIKRKFDNLKELIGALLKMEMAWTPGPSISIGGVPLNQINDRFSQGQKWLLHFATSAYADITLEDPLVLCLDEPELHLHPAALNQILEVLRRTLVGGQILIATHSIPLIAHVGYEDTWFVSAGKISYAGRNPEIVIDGLVGGPVGVQKLRNLLDEPAAAAISRFAFESLLSPAVAVARSSDPQGKQILISLRAKKGALGRAVRVLDYGAGKGRLLDIAADEMAGELISLFDYSAFDPSPENAEICQAAIARVYGSSNGRYFSAASNIVEFLAGKLFDVVILCNVLHEISPLNWRERFSFISTLLADDGEVLIVEDLLLPHGEHAHGEGFVIASSEALRLLFSVKPDEAETMRKQSESLLGTNERLMCVSIPARFVGQISSESVKAALSYIKGYASQRI